MLKAENDKFVKLLYDREKEADRNYQSDLDIKHKKIVQLQQELES